VFAAIDGTLAIEDVFALEHHAASCTACGALLARARSLEESLARLSEPPIEQLDVKRSAQAIARAIERDDEERRARQRPRAAPWIGVAAAAAILVAWFAWSRARSTERDVSSTPAPEIAAVSGMHADVEPAASQPASTDAPRSIDAEAVDPARLSDARSRLRELVRTAAGEQREESASALAARIDDLAATLSREGWPILRLCESLIDDADADIARAALRYLGERGDRLSIAAIKRARTRPGLEAAALDALVDAGEAGSESVQSAIRDPALRAHVLAHVVERGTADSARAIESALRSSSRGKGTIDDKLARDLVDALAKLGEPGVRSLLHLATSRTITDAECLAALQRTGGASDALARLVETTPHEFAPALLLQAIARLACIRALPFVEQMCQDSQHEIEALDALAALGGPDALRSLLKLRLSNTHVAAPLAIAIARDGGAALELANEWIQGGNRRELKRLCDELLANASRASSGALLAIAESDLLTSSDRRWAVLVAGEVGAPADAGSVEDLLRKLEPRDRELRAACLLAIHSLAGPEEVARALEWASPHSAERILALLEGREVRGRPASTLFKIARELESVLTPPNI
jgi:hypothetical protein